MDLGERDEALPTTERLVCMVVQLFSPLRNGLRRLFEGKIGRFMYPGGIVINLVHDIFRDKREIICEIQQR